MIRKTPDKKWQRPTAIMRGMDLWKPMIAACNGLTIVEVLRWRSRATS